MLTLTSSDLPGGICTRTREAKQRSACWFSFLIEGTVERVWRSILLETEDHAGNASVNRRRRGCLHLLQTHSPSDRHVEH